MTPVIEERLAKLAGLSLKAGSHAPGSTFCVMEAVAFVAGEPWSANPICTCPVISTFLRAWNDALPTDADRDRLLKALVPRLVGTRNEKLQKRRSLMAADWLIRVHTPAWLRLAGLTAQADRIASLPEITDMTQYPSLRGPLEAVCDDANAAWNAARVSARDAAKVTSTLVGWSRTADLDAAGDAAGAAAWDAASAANLDAAGAAARVAARAAAKTAALDAAKKKLAPTVLELQNSALQLVERMIDLVESAGE